MDSYSFKKNYENALIYSLIESFPTHLLWILYIYIYIYIYIIGNKNKLLKGI